MHEIQIPCIEEGRKGRNGKWEMEKRVKWLRIVIHGEGWSRWNRIDDFEWIWKIIYFDIGFLDPLPDSPTHIPKTDNLTRRRNIKARY